MVTTPNNAFDTNLKNAVEHINKLCKNLTNTSPKNSLSEQFQQIDQHFRGNSQQMTSKALTAQKQAIFSESFPSLPAQQISQMQTHYISMVAPVNTGIQLTNTPNSQTSGTTLSQQIKATESNFTKMTSSLEKHIQNPNDGLAQERYIANVENYQTSINQLQHALPLASTAQNKMCQQCTDIRRAVSQHQAPGQRTTTPEEANQSIFSLSEQLDKLPQLPALDSSKTTTVTGPYTIAAQAAMKNANTPDIHSTKAINDAIASLNQQGKHLSTLNMANVSVAEDLSEKILRQLQTLKTLLPSVLSLSESGTVLNSSLISQSLQNLTQSKNLSLSEISQLTSALKRSNDLTLDRMNNHLPTAMHTDNLPPLSFDVAESLQQLSADLEKSLSNPNTLPSGVSVNTIQGLQQKAEAILHYNHQFYALDQDNAKKILSTITTPGFGKISKIKTDLSGDSPPTIHALVPNADHILAKLKNSPHIHAIDDQINDINHILSQTTPTPDIKAINQAVDDYVAQADNITQHNMQNSSHTPELTPTAERTQITALTELTIQASTHNVLSGTALKKLAASKAQPQSTMATCTGSQMMCSFGIGPGVYNTLRLTTLINNKPAANISDNIPMVNITPFPGCSSPTNPLMNPFVYPWPCMPIVTPFIPTNVMTMIQGTPINTMNNKAICNYAVGGVISFINPNQITTMTS